LDDGIFRIFKEKVRSTLYYPYFVFKTELLSFLNFKKDMKIKYERIFKFKEQIPVMALEPVYYNRFPYPWEIVLRGKGNKDDVVIKEGVLVGKVRGTEKDLVEVITLYHPDFKCSMVSKSGVLCLWEGRGAEFGIIKFYPSWAPIKKGDTLFTSGITDNFPFGIPAAVVDSVIKSEEEIFFTIYARPLWNPHKYGFYLLIPPSVK
jgi:hypothetical protein